MYVKTLNAYTKTTTNKIATIVRSMFLIRGCLSLSFANPTLVGIIKTILIYDTTMVAVFNQLQLVTNKILRYNTSIPKKGRT